MGQHQGHVIVVSGGGPVPVGALDQLRPGTPVVAADSGVDAALALGLHVDVAVGDFDSVTAHGLAEVEAAGARVIRHPDAKDATDLALALGQAGELLGADRGEIVVLGAEAGRLDHLLAGILALAHAAHAGHAVRAYLGAATVHVVHGPGVVDIDAPIGAVLTVLPVGGSADGITTTGLRYPLRGEPLEPGSTRGVSNVVDAAGARVEVEGGTVLVVLPGHEEDDGGRS
jgi:thiamine pyrophosphokinase